jgi:PAS domain S-box-containing protein
MSTGMVVNMIRSTDEYVDVKNRTGDINSARYFHSDDAEKTDAAVQRKDAPILNEAGDYVGLQATSRDIIECKQLEEDLRESKQRFRLFFENAPEYCYMISSEGIVLDINNSALMALRYSKEEVIGKPLLTTIYSPSSRRKAKRLFETWKKTGQLRDEELTIITKNGEERTVLLSANSVKDTNGKIIQSISVQRDVTERKKMEEEIKSLAKFPSENPNPVLRITKDGVILYANASALSMLGEWKRGIGQTAPKPWCELAFDVLSSGLTKEIEVKHGNETFLFTLVPIIDRAYVNMYGNDITEHKRQEKILRNLKITKEKVDVFDLIIATLVEHEKEQDSLTSELRIISEQLRSYLDY